MRAVRPHPGHQCAERRRRWPLSAIHYNRETFRDDDSIRVHPIITKGGEAVSAVPADVRMETLRPGAALSGRHYGRQHQGGPRPSRQERWPSAATWLFRPFRVTCPCVKNSTFNDVFRANAVQLVGEENVGHVARRGGSTDMGDISHLMPAIHPYVGGATGIGHGANYVVQDYSLAVITAAKALGLHCY